MQQFTSNDGRKWIYQRYHVLLPDFGQEIVFHVIGTLVIRVNLNKP